MKSIDQGFKDFATRLTTLPRESEAAKRHRASIEACLDNEYGLEGFFQSGSFGNGTNIPQHSDVDRFAVLPGEFMHNNPLVVLRKVHRVLARRFPNTPGIRIRPPAIEIPFGDDGSEKTEVVPAFYASRRSGHDVYFITRPYGAPRWMLSSPGALRAHLNDVDLACDGQLKPLVRFLKSWKYHRKVPIQSIYLELVCAAHARSMGLLMPSVDIAKILHLLRTTKLGSINDPLGIGESVAGPLSPSKAELARNKTANSAKIASRAVSEEIAWRVKPAFRLWKALLGPQFPDGA